MSATTSSAGWEDVELGDVVTLHRGYDLPSSQRRVGRVPVISSSGITGYHHEAKIAPPGVVTGRYGTLGEVFFVEEPFWPLNTTLYVSDFHGNDERFVSYFLRCQGLGAQDAAAAVPGVNRNVLHRLPARRPPLTTQRKIAGVLSAYDDLIENNNRRIKILDDMAQRIYHEWFVDFRYPGREDVPLMDTELGPLPEGWMPSVIADLCSSIDYGYTASAEGECIGPRLLRITDIVPPQIDWTTVPYCKIDANRIERFRLLTGDIVVARTGATVGFAKRMNKRHPASVFASYLVRFRAGPKADDIWLGTFIESDAYKAYVKSNAGGAAQPNASAKLLAAADIALPDRGVQSLFREAVDPLVDQKELLQVANVHLRAARALLLPRLISGEIDVENLNITLPDIAA